MLVLKWVQQLLSKALQIVEKYISKNSNVTKGSSLYTPPTTGRKAKKAAARSLSEAVTAVYTIGSLVIVCPSADMSSITPLLHSMITSGNSDPKLNKLPGSTLCLRQTAPSLYIQAWLTMGKLCLADDKLAKRYIPLFVQVCSLLYQCICSEFSHDSQTTNQRNVFNSTTTDYTQTFLQFSSTYALFMIHQQRDVFSACKISLFIPNYCFHLHVYLTQLNRKMLR